VLSDIFTPNDKKSLELDSVYQIKKYTKEYYQRKIILSKELLETLDAMNNERPSVIEFKRKHFDLDQNVTKHDQLEWMRLNAEQDRVTKF
jgi:hypothetical protein